MRLALLLLAASGLSADFDAKLWRHRRAITAVEPVTRLALPPAIFGQAQPSLGDLRVVSSAGAEVPYLLTVAQARTQTQAVPVRLVNRESRNGALRATLEFDGQQVHNRLTLVVTRQDFRSKVLVEASEDGRAWATVRRAAFVFRYRGDDGQLAEHLTIHYPDSRRRRLRLTLEDWPVAAEFQGVQLESATANEARRAVVWEGAPRAVESGARKRSCYQFHTGSMAPYDRLTVRPAVTSTAAAAAPASFHRSVMVETSRDGQRWMWVATGALYRTEHDESLTVELPEAVTPELRLCIFQGDDVPLQVEAVRVEGVQREVTFRAAPQTQYWLYHGNPVAMPPSYDLARTAGAELAGAALAGSWGAAEGNPQYVGPAPPVVPWTDRYPAVLYSGLALAVAGLGWLALRLLRSA